MQYEIVVEVAVPGLGIELNAMHAFHQQHGIQDARIQHRHEDGHHCLLWFFDRRATAEEFAVEFGGTLLG